MTQIAEIASDMYRISTFIPDTLLCSDLFHQNGDVEPSTSADVVGRFKQMLVEYQQGPFAHYLPYTPDTEPTLQRLAALQPRTLATMHGSTFVGDGAQALTDLAQVMHEVGGRRSRADCHPLLVRRTTACS